MVKQSKYYTDASHLTNTDKWDHRRGWWRLLSCLLQCLCPICSVSRDPTKHFVHRDWKRRFVVFKHDRCAVLFFNLFLALSPHSNKGPRFDSRPLCVAFACSPRVLCEFPPGTTASSHENSPNLASCLFYFLPHCLCVCVCVCVSVLHTNTNTHTHKHTHTGHHGRAVKLKITRRVPELTWTVFQVTVSVIKLLQVKSQNFIGLSVHSHKHSTRAQQWTAHCNKQAKQKAVCYVV